MGFREIEDVRQDAPGLRRRWFRSDDLDVLVDQHGETPQQLSVTYTWDNQLMQLLSVGARLQNHVLDDGESRPGRMKATPIADAEAPLPASWLRQHFHDGDGLPSWLSRHIRALLENY